MQEDPLLLAAPFWSIEKVLATCTAGFYLLTTYFIT